MKRAFTLLVVAVLLYCSGQVHATVSTIGFNFRSTSIFVTDASTASPVLGEAYPHTYTNANGVAVVAGWNLSLGNCTAPSSVQTRNRNAGLDARLAGINFPAGDNAGPTGFQCRFRVDLPTSGNWTIALAAGDANNAMSQYVQFADNGVVFATYTAVATGANSFMDANGTVFTNANWLTSNTTLNHVFTSTLFELIAGPNVAGGSADTTIAHLLLIGGGAAHTGGQLFSAPLMPQVMPSATYPPDTGYTLTAVASGANLQTAINAAACGTKLNLAHGGTFTTVAAWTLPNNSCTCHTDPTKWQIIQGDQFEANYVAGIRVDPSVQYAQFPHLSSSDANYAFTALANGASCWGFAGLDVASSTNGANSLFVINDGSQTIANYSHDFAWWGNYLHGLPTKGIRRGITLNGNFEAIVDNYISDIHLVGQDGQGIGGWDGIGGILIQNNFIGAGSTAIGFGGADPQAGIIPADYTIARNHMWKSLTWRVGDPSYGGIHYQEKNIFEIKDSQRLLGTANVLDYSWQDAQTGQAILWNTSNQSGTDPQATNQDINWYYNIVRHASKVYELGANANPTQQPNHRTFAHDNLDWDIDSSLWANSVSFDVSIGGLPVGTIFLPYDNWWVHETISSSSQSVGVEFDDGTNPNYGFIFKDSIIDRATYGAFKGIGIGDAAMPTPKTPGGQADHNCIYGPNLQGETYNNAIFTGRQLVTSGPSGVFVSPGVDFHVAPASVCHNAASDGTDMGANIDAVTSATSGVVQTLANLHTVTNVSPSTFTHLGSTSITITGTNFISGAADVIIGGAGPSVPETSNSCGLSTPGQFTVTVSTDTTHFTYTGACAVVTSAPITLAVNDTINVTAAQTVNRYTPGNLCTSLSVTNSTTITCTTPAATGTVTNGQVSIFVSQFGIPIQSTVFGAYN